MCGRLRNVFLCRRPMQKPEGRGALWMYAYSDAVSSTSKERQSGTKLMNAVKPLRLSLEGLPSPYDFHPLGIAVHPMNSDGNGAKVARLFVINHQRARSTIDVFDLLRSQTSREGEEEEDQSGRWRAVFVRSLVDPIATHTPNSLVALSADEVLVTQDHLFALRPPSSLDDLTATWRLVVPPLSLLPPAIARYCAQLARLGAPLLARIETLLGLPLGWVTYVKFDDDDVNGRAESHHQTKIIARWIAFANGLALSPNGKFLAVASTVMPGIKLYEWSEAKREVVRLAHRINTPNLSDNIAFTKGASGIPGGNDLFGNGARLIGGGGPSGLELMRFARDPHNYSKRAHSWIISISPTPPKDDSNDDDDSYVSANARMIRQNEGFHISTVYQGHGPVQRVQVAANLDSETEDGQDWIGIASATSAAYDGSIGGGTLLVPGLYSKPGVMVCANVGL